MKHQGISWIMAFTSNIIQLKQLFFYVFCMFLCQKSLTDDKNRSQMTPLWWLPEVPAHLVQDVSQILQEHQAWVPTACAAGATAWCREIALQGCQLISADRKMFQSGSNLVRIWLHMLHMLHSMHSDIAIMMHLCAAMCCHGIFCSLCATCETCLKAPFTGKPDRPHRVSCLDHVQRTDI